MNSEKPDFIGWLIPIAVTVLALYSAMKSPGDAAIAMAAAVILLAWAERKRTKIVTAALIRIVDEKGDPRALIGWAHQGVQVDVSTAPLNNNAIVYAGLWQKTPSVSFTFQYSEAYTSSGELFECSPSLEVAGNMEGKHRSYWVDFSYATAAKKPNLSICESTNEGILRRSIHLS